MSSCTSSSQHPLPVAEAGGLQLRKAVSLPSFLNYSEKYNVSLSSMPSKHTFLNTLNFLPNALDFLPLSLKPLLSLAGGRCV